MKFRWMIVLAVSFATLAIGVLGARAQGDVCRGLENELARLSSVTSGRTPEVAKWDRTIEDQTIAIERTVQIKRRAGCDGGGFLFRRADPVQCKALDKQVRAMSAKLAKMERSRDRAARKSTAGANIDGRIGIVRQQLKQNDCGAPQIRSSSRGPDGSARSGDTRVRYLPSNGGRLIRRVAPDRNGVIDERPERRPQSLFGLLFGGSSRRETVYENDRRDGYENDWNGGFAGTYRTLCVRSCDGYYFPISFSTTQQSFAKDANMCSRMCPAAEARLFIHRNPGQDSKQMISLDGQPYSETENAFRYRQEFDSGCSCQNQQLANASGLTALTTSGDNPRTLGEVTSLVETTGLRPLSAPVPPRKLSYDEDPDTIANQRGGFSPQDLLKSMNAATTTTATKDGSEKTARTAPGDIRKVGPDYFAVQ